jgi:carbon monoxide dehydrogenase subunit G
VAIRVDERYVVHAPMAPVWDFLVDPRRVVRCVPGGELGAVVDDRTFDGRLRVGVGPLILAYSGRVRLADVDVAARKVKIVGDARETAGSDSAQLTLESWLAALPDGSTEVVAHARVDVEGRVVELGRGMLEQLGHVVFQEFAARVRASVEAEQRKVGAARATAPQQRAEPLRAVPLVLRALRAWVACWRDRRSGGGPHSIYR